MSNGSSTATMNLVIVNPPGSGAADDEIWVCVIGQDPAAPGTYGYLDLSAASPAAQMVYPESPGWDYQSGVYSQTLAQVAANFPDGIPVPAILSARIYFAVGADFPPSEMSPSGPPPGFGCQTFYDFAEFDTTVSGDYNINPSTVDFFGISYSIAAVPVGASPPEPQTVGFDVTRQAVVDALWNIPSSPAGQKSGNLGIFRDCFITAPAAASPSSTLDVLRVLSPMSMALTDWPSATQATQCSHFFDDYVNEHCFAPGREFSFYTKNWSPTDPGPMIWAQVSPDGTSVSLYSNDVSPPEPYAPVPVLGRPSAPWPNPPFSTPSNYQNIVGTTAGEIDWGFLLIGNAAAPQDVPGVSPPEADLAWAWGSDPAAMAFMISICRGVAHLDGTEWVDPANYYLGNGGGTSTASMPILYYSKVLHQQGIDGLAYALSYDDIYGQNAGIAFADGATVTLTLNDVGPATVTLPS